MKELFQTYIENVQKYNQLENITFSNLDSDFDILNTLSQNTREKKELQKQQNAIIEQLLLPFEKEEKSLNEETFLQLREFAITLFNGVSVIDTALAFRINKLLLKHVKSTCDYDNIIEQIYWCGLCKWKIGKYDNTYFSNEFFEQVLEYKEKFAILSEKAKCFYLRCMGNRILNYTNKDPDPLLRLGEKIIKEFDEIEKQYPDLDYDYDAARLTIYRNMTTGLSGFRANIGVTEQNKKVLLHAAQKSVEMIGKKDSTLMPFESGYYYCYHAARFHAGLLDLETFLKYLELISEPQERYGKRENCNRVFFNSAGYLEYLNIYSDKSKEEIALIVRDKVNKVLEYASALERDEESSFVDEYLLSFLKASFNALPFDMTRKILFEITISRHKPTYIHTQVVKLICEELVRSILKENPEQFVGIIDQYTLEDVLANKEQIVGLMGDMAQLHDLGKCSCMQVISNTSRRLEDCEFEVIKRHPALGFQIIEECYPVKVVEEGIMYHHVWHNGQGGYPLNMPPTMNQPLIDILTIADCLDAATDVFGRTYTHPKTVKEVIGEFEAGRDTQYAGFVIDALNRPEVFESVNRIVESSRKEIICRSYRKRNSSIRDTGVLADNLLQKNISLENKITNLEIRNQQLETLDVRKNQYISQISHEMRTPLNIILGLASMARDEITNEQMVGEYLRDIESGSRMLIGLVNDVLDIAGLANGTLRVEKAKFDLKEQITNLSILFYEQAKYKDVHFDIHVKGVSEEFIVGDEKRVTQILLNLLNSSAKLTPAGGKIDLTVMQASESRERVHMRFIIKSTGTSSASEILNDVIGKYENKESLDKKFSSETALGISIAKQLVDVLSGNIYTNNEEEDGTQIVVDLPFEKTKQADYLQLSKMQNYKVLVIANSEEICNERGAMLADMGLMYDIAWDSGQALDLIGIAEDEKKPYKICMIDWNMIREPADMIISEIRNIFGQELVIIATAFDAKRVNDDGLCAGANYVIENTLFRSTVFDALSKIEKGEVVKQETIKEIAEKYDFSGKNILVVEDVPLNMEVIVKILRKVNATIICAEHGKEALTTYLGKPDGYFDCIFMDINMPIMDGYEATKRIRNSGRADAKIVPIYAMTANAFTTDIANALNAGMNGHIAKPIDIAVLYDTLQNIFYDNSSLKLQETLMEQANQLKQQNEELRKQAESDPLTHLLNRYGFEKRVNELLQKEEPIGFMIIDVDHFKEINDLYGHHIGDNVLVKVAKCLQSCFTEEDMVIRFGGDEFVVVLKEIHREKAPEIVRKINKMLLDSKEGIPAVSISAGVAYSDNGYQNSLYEQADIALYQTKKKGRCGCTIYKGDGE